MSYLTAHRDSDSCLVSRTVRLLAAILPMTALALGLLVLVLHSSSSYPARAARLEQSVRIDAPPSNLAGPALPSPTTATVHALTSANTPFYLSWSSYETDHSKSIAWGDYDGNGTLDLAVGNYGQPIRIYRNDGMVGGVPLLTLAWTATLTDTTSSVAWGDYDGNGSLDLAVGNYGGPVRIYHNDGIVGGALHMTLVWSSPEIDYVSSLAWGDYNGDGRLDLAVGTGCAFPPDTGCSQNRIYRNDGMAGGVLAMAVAWTSNDRDNTYAVAWGDYDGDGKLDLAVGNYGQPIRLYHNSNGTLTTNAIWSSAETGNNTTSIAWGDYDGNGFLDLAAGNYGGPIRLYHNISGTLATSAVWSSTETGNTNSIAWGDYDGDGRPDLVAGNYGGPIRLYHNISGTLATSAVWSSAETDNTTSIAWGDFDGDGTLDFAVGNYGQPVRLYRNDGSTLMPGAAWSSVETDNTYCIAWGDYDGDGKLDLAVGNNGQSIRIYHNDGAAGEIPYMTLVWSSSEAGNTTSLAWGDYNGDGRLDLAVGNDGQRNRVYRNDGVAAGGAPTMALVWSSAEIENTTSIAWGDYDGDGELDLAVGNYGQPVRLYHNVGGTLTPSAVWSSAEAGNATSIAWGDYDGDGELDLAVGNYGQPVRLYHNVNGTLATSAVWSSAETNNTTSIAWGDYDGDGKLDLAVGNYGQPIRLYHNGNGMLTPSAVWSSAEANNTYSVAWGDYNGDGRLDLAVGNWNQPTRIYRNDSGVLTRNAAWSSVEADNTKNIAWGDYDGDGDLDLAVGNAGQPNRLYRNSRDARSSPGAVPSMSVTRPGPNADFYSAPKVQVGPTIPITYTVSHPQAQRIKSIHAYYSPDGGGFWLPATAAGGTITTNLVTPGTYTYNWDVFADSFFGRSDDIILRLVAIPDIAPRLNQVAGPYLYGGYSAATFPFRVRGTQMRVISGTVPVPNAIVYRLPAGQSVRAQPIADEAGVPFRTDGQGYLQGRGQIAAGDRLIALLPITSTTEYQLYYTSAAPTPTGLDAYVATANGVQTLTVSAQNPLVLFNLDVSLEWDASQDTAYLNQLGFNLQRASEILYDITNGQAALGSVTVYQNREKWDDAHIRIFANNQLRPFANQGGIVSSPITDPITSTVVYFPGQLSIGATWNRYGNAGITLGEDWPRTLAHELGHYVLYLDDDYLGLNAQGQFMPVSTCSGTIMSDAYRDDYSELHGPINWQRDCADTLSNRSTGRSDWETVLTFYPALYLADNPGPSSLPLAVTQVNFVEPITPTTALPDPRFYLVTSDGASIQPGNRAQAYLFRDDQLFNLGRPVVDQVLARGARPGDRVCVFELEAERLGCKTVTADDNQQLTLYTISNWQPDVRITPVNSQTVALQVVVNLPSDKSVGARLYDGTGFATTPITLTRSSDSGVYSGTFNLNAPVFAADIDIWVDEANLRRESVASYSLGGNPGHMRGGFGHMRGGFAPVLSGDGQVILYSTNLDFAPGEFYILQAATRIPDPPTWATVVGKGYWLSRSPDAPELVGSSISMSYAQNEVPPGEEPFLQVYFWNGTTWTELPTTLATDVNTAVAPAQGQGLYALMASIKIPLHGPGWELFSYPSQVTQPVTQALQSVAGYYSTVYGYDWNDAADPWKVYDTSVPTWVNDLHTLEFGQVYWISMTQAITLYLKGDGTPAMASSNSNQLPPATYYEEVSGNADFLPAPGMTVTAWINGHLCGQGQTFETNGQVVYTINVFAEIPGDNTGCGVPGRTVRFKVGSYDMPWAAIWDNNRLWRVSLGSHRLYLPLIIRES